MTPRTLFMDGHLISRSLGNDLLAGVAVAAAVAWAIWIFAVPPVVLLCLAGVAFVRVFASLRRLHTAAPFQFQHFEPAPLDFVDSDERMAAALDEVAASIGTVAAANGQAAPLPTVREMQLSIQQRLNAVEAGEDSPAHASDGADGEELRAAIQALRRARG
jgi:hypothetical protein